MQAKAAVFAVLVIYSVGLPLEISFAFKFEWGIIGIWMGFAIATIILFISFLLVLLLQDW